SWLRGAGGTHGMAFSSVQYSAAPSVLHIDRTRNWRADLAFCRTTSEAQSGCRADGETSDEVRNAERRAQGRSFRIGNAALKPRLIRGAGAVRYGPDRFAVEFRFEGQHAAARECVLPALFFVGEAGFQHQDQLRIRPLHVREECAVNDVAAVGFVAVQRAGE